jgi:hypothetical protein
VWRKGPPQRGGLTTEGTLGAAERVFLRGNAREAALLGTKRKRVSRAVSPAKAEQNARWVRVTALATPASEVADPRQEVSEPIGLGQSSRRAQAHREALSTKVRAGVEISP